jgi:hypothetical protein
MRAKKDDDGFMSAEQQNHRFINVLQLIYMSAKKNDVGSGYVIPADTLAKVEMELDFNTNEKTKSKIISEQIKKYRKRKSYIFWWDILSKGSYCDYNQALSVLMSIHNKTGGMHQSMTHVRYAMETMYLALDDYFNTNKLKVVPNRFLTRKTKTKARKKKRKASTPPSAFANNDSDEILF